MPYRDPEAGRQKSAEYRAAHREEGRARTKRWRAQNPDKWRAQQRLYRQRHPQKLTDAARIYQRAKLNIKNLPPEPPFGTPCEICQRVPNHHLAADHDHKTGEFRGWLCGACNRGLGSLADDPIIVEAALVYLVSHRCRSRCRLLH